MDIEVILKAAAIIAYIVIGGAYLWVTRKK